VAKVNTVRDNDPPANYNLLLLRDTENLYQNTQKQNRIAHNMASALETEFKDYADKVKNLKSKPDNSELLTLYALFKQSTVGDCTGDRPGIFSPTDRAKYDAWKEREGMSKEDAMKEYIDLAKSMIEKYGL
jgi:diazepam-binding inhibitor (GABA receptor modulating acyl-CoA-binding protein)